MAQKSLAQAVALRRAELERGDTLRELAIVWFLRVFELEVQPEAVTICQREDEIEVHLRYEEGGQTANVYAALTYGHPFKEKRVYWPEHFYRWQLKRQPAAIYETVVDAILADLNMEVVWSQERKKTA